MPIDVQIARGEWPLPMNARAHLLAAVELLAPETMDRFTVLVKFLANGKRDEREICARVAAELSIYLQYGDMPVMS